MYVDPSRVEMALHYAALALRPPAEKSAKNVEVTLFIASLWADATPAARTKYKATVATQAGALPWSALTKPTQVMAVQAGPGKIGALAPTLRGPAVVLLILGQADPEDEGVDGFRLIAGEPRADAIIAALYEWDVPLLTRTATPAGWNLEGAVEPVDDGAGADKGADAPELDPVDGADVDVDVDAPADDETVTTTGPTRRQKQLVAAGVAAGFAVLGVAAWRLG